MTSRDSFDREGSIARVLRPLGQGPLTLEQARRAGQLLGMSGRRSESALIWPA